MDIENYTIETATKFGEEYVILFLICKTLNISTNKTIGDVGTFTVQQIKRLMNLIKNRIK